ncbi:uncharacterized protein FA14DRAFT_181365 [Meira miltonrushii]|uniref:G protein-coupled receptor n=1 Tax=Meira miltonrushii TaxID=1280837 RepID=A0A316V614_9BASI|nr:uncharacterized protein FA14DRAFT_181365 [Meira miltonrushii]PWN32684.1 hypothetical protein FA14DRAFT_181365 [Meira miltonrushii]
MGGTYWNEEFSTFEYDEKASEMAYFNVFRLVLCSTWLGAMTVVAIAYYYLSKEDRRATKLFRLQGTCLVLTVLYNASETGCVLYRLDSLTYLASQNMNYRGYCAWRSVGIFAEHAIPILSDSALLFRISSFYPSPIVSGKARLLILSPFWFLLGSRTILTFLLTAIILVQWLSGLQPYAYDAMLLWDPPVWSYDGYSATTVLEFSLGSIYCIAASSLLLFKAYQLAKSRISFNNKAGVKAKMRFFAEALLMCCVPPIFLNVAAPIQLLAFYNYAYYRETAFWQLLGQTFEPIGAKVKYLVSQTSKKVL